MSQLRLRSRFVLVAVAALLITSLPAGAQLSGIRVSTPSVDFNTFDVTADLTVFYGGTIAFATAWVGDTSGFGTVANALEWGDGVVIPPIYPTGIPFVTTSTPPGAGSPQRAYRASFMHTYPDATQRTITVNSHNLVFSAGYGFTGTTATFQTPTYSVFGGTRMVLQNTAQVVFTPPIIQVPTVSTLGLILLALGLIAVAIPMIRRG